LIVQNIVGNDKLTFRYLLAPSSKISEPFTAHGKFFRQIYQKKMVIFTKIENLSFFIPIIIPMLLPGHNTKKY
jgi:hypothetical protein